MQAKTAFSIIKLTVISFIASALIACGPEKQSEAAGDTACLLYTSPSPRDS